MWRLVAITVIAILGTASGLACEKPTASQAGPTPLELFLQQTLPATEQIGDIDNRVVQALSTLRLESDRPDPRYQPKTQLQAIYTYSELTIITSAAQFEKAQRTPPQIYMANDLRAALEAAIAVLDQGVLELETAVDLLRLVDVPDEAALLHNLQVSAFTALGDSYRQIRSNKHALLTYAEIPLLDELREEQLLQMERHALDSAELEFNRLRRRQDSGM